ncbi:MAG: hypothetical protein NT074_02695 [Methanomicrobiales archaeon]|jgi:protein tyrosine phosphatase (PTP) superfamily phosphohydrolase (DUF442 family)|nr:hypothetical protein [Methanomicrobiales archaeon]
MKTKEGTSGMSMIQPTSFYSSKKEKTKFNWFCYELSMAIYDTTKKSNENLLKRYQIGNEDLALFSIYISKKMKDIILHRPDGKIEKVDISQEIIGSYFPDINEKLVKNLQDAIAQACDELLSFCKLCPNRCISQKDAYCTMFDQKSWFD